MANLYFTSMSKPESPSPALSRRAFTVGLLAALPLARPLSALAAEATLQEGLARLEKRRGGRLGVALLDGEAPALGYRLNERFAMCSTFKLPLAGAVLARVDGGLEQLDRRLAIVASEVIANSPVTGPRAGQTLTVLELCEAMVTTSDNTAANLMLKATGGPEAFTTWLRSLGDTVTRLDRYEPEMNGMDLEKGDERDTTSPAGMAHTVRALALRDTLTAESRDRLVGWMIATQTGLTRLRAGLPKDWKVGDKTGTGGYGPTNDVAVAWPPDRAPIVLSAYYDRRGRSMEDNAAVLAEVGRLVASHLGA